MQILAGSMDSMIATTRQVSVATSEQKQAGRQMLAASEVLMRLADDYRKAADRVAADAAGLRDDARSLNDIVDAFRL